MKGICFLLLMLVALHSLAEPRRGKDEWNFGMFVVGANDYAFEGGASARTTGGVGFGMTWSHNLNDHLSVGIDATLGEFGYRAIVAPGTGNGAAAFERDGNTQTAALRARATWHLLAGSTTPFLTANAGWMYLDPYLGATNPPASACWVYPWYGEVCGDRIPDNSLHRFTYGIGTGLLIDMHQSYLRATLGAEWLDFDNALSRVGYVTARIDFGIRF